VDDKQRNDEFGSMTCSAADTLEDVDVFESIDSLPDKAVWRALIRPLVLEMHHAGFVEVRITQNRGRANIEFRVK
jgi:hypothetical protein